MQIDCFYFGCWGRPGHYLFAPNGQHVYEHTHALPPDFPVKVCTLDGGLLGYPQREVEGEAVLTLIRNWTIISFWDRTVDHRGACNSNFVMRGRLLFDQAIEVAKSQYPTIFARFNFEVKEKAEAIQ